MDEPQRLDIGQAHALAMISANAVGMSLGTWAGRGAWASMTDAARDRAGARALTEFDTAIAEMIAVRESLAATLAASEVPTVQVIAELPSGVTDIRAARSRSHRSE
jgi:hypothetical protein